MSDEKQYEEALPPPETEPEPVKTPDVVNTPIVEDQPGNLASDHQELDIPIENETIVEITGDGSPADVVAEEAFVEIIVDEPPAEQPGEEDAGEFEQPTREELTAEVNRLVERIRAYAPDYQPPPFSPRRLLEMIGENVQKMTPDFGRELFEKLRGSLSSDLFDLDTWKGIWYMVNFTIEYQADFFKRRFTGEYEVDEWGYDPELMGLFKPFVGFMYQKYWRVQTSGIDRIPEEGRAMLVSNHSGQLPFDAAMIGMAILEEHPSQRLVRSLYASWFPTVPFVSSLLVKMGQAMATEENGVRLLEQEQLVSVFPEGIKGVGKLYKDRYKLARFGRGGFVRMALKTQAPIIPVSVVGAEEIYISLYNAKMIARLIGFPFFPITITWPWFGLLGFVPLPTKWYIDFGEPIQTDNYGPDAYNNLNLVSQLTDQVRNRIQDSIHTRLAERRSIFLG
jgi:1-acyl-sn-glycerol-3-phosphate acyltransferase